MAEQFLLHPHIPYPVSKTVTSNMILSKTAFRAKIRKPLLLYPLPELMSELNLHKADLMWKVEL